MSQDRFTLDLRGLDVDTIEVVSADSIVAEGHGAIEIGQSCYSPYCSSYIGASCPGCSCGPGSAASRSGELAEE